MWPGARKRLRSARYSTQARSHRTNVSQIRIGHRATAHWPNNVVWMEGQPPLLLRIGDLDSRAETFSDRGGSAGVVSVLARVRGARKARVVASLTVAPSGLGLEHWWTSSGFHCVSLEVPVFKVFKPCDLFL